MSTLHSIRIRPTGGSPMVLEWHDAALIDELVDGDRVGPEVEILVGEEWVGLREHPTKPWCDRMAERACDAFNRGDPVTAAGFARKVLRYNHEDDGANPHEAVRLAKLILGHLELCAGRPREAVPLLGSAASHRSRFVAVALNNLGVAWAQALHPEAALGALRASLDAGGFPVASLSLRNLAATLAAEGAPAIPGEPPWAVIAQAEEDKLRRSDAPGHIRAFIGSHRGFPGPAFWHVFRQRAYVPEVGSRLVVEHSGRHASQWLLSEGDRAWNDGEDIAALVLASAAERFDPASRSQAQHQAATAATRLESRRALDRARRCANWIIIFTRRLRDLTLDDLDAAREAQAALSSFVDISGLETIYKNRIEDLVIESIDLESADTDRRGRLWITAHQFSSPEEAEGRQRAALRCQVGRLLQGFWKSILETGDCAVAAGLLREVEATLLSADTLPNEHAVLERLQSLRAAVTTDLSAEPLSGEAF